MDRLKEILRTLGSHVTGAVWRMGFASRFFWLTLLQSGTSFRRLQLTIREVYFAGVLSLVIILVSGLFVGMVLGLQGYDTLVRYGSAEALGVMVSLSLIRELGPVVAGLLFASRAGSAITAEIVVLVTDAGGGRSARGCVQWCSQELRVRDRHHLDCGVRRV